jgi:hypothetical protein
MPHSLLPQSIAQTTPPLFPLVILSRKWVQSAFEGFFAVSFRSAGILSHLPHAVERSKWIGNTIGALRVILPRSIYKESVLITTWSKIDRKLPNPSLVFFHGMARRIPSIEIPCQRDMLGVRCQETERYLFRFASF